MKSFFAIFLLTPVAFCADYLTGQAARLVIGQPSFTELLFQQPTTATVVGAPSGVAFANDTLFVADSNRIGATPVNNRVLIYTPVSALPTPFKVPSRPDSLNVNCPVCVGTATAALGQPDLVSFNPSLTQSGLRTPTAVATDGKILAVADTDNNRVLIWKTIPTVSGTNADVVIGQPDFTHATASSPPSSTSLRGPQGVWVANGKIFIADTLNNRVLIYNSVPSSNGAQADVAVGAPDFNTLIVPPVTRQTVAPTQTNLDSPTSVTTDGTRLYVTDLGHNRVLIWNSIPTTNNQTADLVLGQPDFVSELQNNSSTVCASNGTDSDNNPTYPARCAATLSFPRFAFSDGQKFYVSDGGNDRVLVYNAIPTANAAKADAILGQPDENTDASSANTDSMAAPTSLAWDGENLYVTDTYNLRVLVFTPLGSQIPLTAVRNAASLEIFGTGRVTFAGTPAEKNEVDLTVGDVTYKYTVQTNDTLANIADALVAQINGTASGSTQDPIVYAVSDTGNPGVILIARKAGSAGTGTAYSTTISTGATITSTSAGSSIAINLASASAIAPGTLITIYGTDLSEHTQAFDYTSETLPETLGGTTVFINGLRTPLLYVSPTQINAQMPYEVQDTSSASLYVVTEHVGGPATASNAIGTVIVGENPGLFTFGGQDPRPGLVYHLSANASGLVSVDGTVTAGNTASIVVAGTTYTYTVVTGDTLTTIRDGLIKLLANDPNVTATPTNTFTRIFLQAKVAGTAGNNIAFSTSTSTAATVVLSAFSNGGKLCCGNSGGGPVTDKNPAVPGEVVFAYATGLGITDYPALDSKTGVRVTGPLYPTKVPVDSILVGGKTANIVSASLVPGQVGLFQVVFQLSTGLPTDPLTQLTIAQLDFVSNIVTFPVQAPPSQ